MADAAATTDPAMSSIAETSDFNTQVTKETGYSNTLITKEDGDSDTQVTKDAEFELTGNSLSKIQATDILLTETRTITQKCNETSKVLFSPQISFKENTQILPEPQASILTVSAVEEATLNMDTLVQTQAEKVMDKESSVGMENDISIHIPEDNTKYQTKKEQTENLETVLDRLGVAEKKTENTMFEKKNVSFPIPDSKDQNNSIIETNDQNNSFVETNNQNNPIPETKYVKDSILKTATALVTESNTEDDGKEIEKKLLGSPLSASYLLLKDGTINNSDTIKKHNLFPESNPCAVTSDMENELLESIPTSTPPLPMDEEELIENNLNNELPEGCATHNSEDSQMEISVEVPQQIEEQSTSMNIKVEVLDNIENEVHNNEEMQIESEVGSAPFIKSEFPEDIEMAQNENELADQASIIEKDLNGMGKVESGIENGEMCDREQEGERTVTMMDVLQEQEELEDNAEAVLGASDDKNCTYSEGYIRRQALYACLTCTSEAKIDPKRRAGVCLACSLSCHENHELVELYTKRNFRCDCGNPNFNSHPCSFTKDKLEFNTGNKYNQNFSGLYCICHRPYPDPEANIDDEMIQCIICEDWLHASHLDAVVPENDQYSEMVCKSCMEKNEFLHDYSSCVVNVDENIDILTTDEINNFHKDAENKYPEIPSKVVENPQKNDDIDLDCATVLQNVSAGNLNSSTKIAGKENEEQALDTPIVSTVCIGLNQSKEKIETDNNDEHTMDTEKTQIVTESNEKVETDTSNIIEIAEQRKSEFVNKNSELLTLGNVGNSDSKQLEENSEFDVKGNCNALTDILPEISTEKTPKTVDNENNTSERTIELETPEETVMTRLEGEDLITGNNLSENQIIVSTNEKICNEHKSLSENPSSDIDPKDEQITVSSNEENNENESINNLKIIDSSDENKQTPVTGPSTHSKETVDELSEKNADNADVAIKLCTDDVSHIRAELEKTPSPYISKTIETDIMKDDADNLQISTVVTATIADMAHDRNKKHQDSSTSDDNLSTPITATIAPITNDENKDTLDNFMSDDNLSVPITTSTASITNDENKDEKVSSKLDDNLCITATISHIINDENRDGQESTTDTGNTCNGTTNKRKLPTAEETDIISNKKTKLDNGVDNKDICKRPKDLLRKYKGATFWPCSWRQKLCSCDNCVTMYRDKDVMFLLDVEDTVSAYEELGKVKNPGKFSQYEKGIKALTSLDRIQQINALTEYNKMKDELLNYLISFKDRQEVVKVEDIEKFFSDIKPKKKPDGVYFCR